MKKRTIFITALLNIFTFVHAQNNCNCKEYINDVEILIENNYADRGSVQKKEYQDALKLAKLESKNISYDDCILLIYKLVSKLKDNHVTFFLEKDSGSIFLRQLYDSTTMNNFFLKYAKLPKTNNIEGLWETENKDLEYIIQKTVNKKEYIVLIWNSKIDIYKRGQIKGTLTKLNDKEFVYKSYGSTKIATAYKMIYKEGNLYSFTTGVWRRQLPQKKPVRTSLIPSLKNLSPGTILLTLPSFSFQNKIIIDSLIRTSKLNKTEHLIIDMRTNLGGSIQAYQSILRYTYTNPIRIESGLYYSSKKNIDHLKNTLLILTDTSPYYNAYKKLIAQAEKAPGSMVQDTGYFYSQDSIYEFPKRVSVIVGKRCGSAGELFLISALQSKKVTLFGENSAGICDRLDAYSFTGNCKGLRMSIPISLRMQESYLKNIDNIGIPPHVKIPKEADWINFVLNYKFKAQK